MGVHEDAGRLFVSLVLPVYQDLTDHIETTFEGLPLRSELRGSIQDSKDKLLKYSASLASTRSTPLSSILGSRIPYLVGILTTVYSLTIQDDEKRDSLVNEVKQHLLTTTSRLPQ